MDRRTEVVVLGLRTGGHGAVPGGQGDRRGIAAAIAEMTGRGRAVGRAEARWAGPCGHFRPHPHGVAILLGDRTDTGQEHAGQEAQHAAGSDHQAPRHTGGPQRRGRFRDHPDIGRVDALLFTGFPGAQQVGFIDCPRRLDLALQFAQPHEGAARRHLIGLQLVELPGEIAVCALGAGEIGLCPGNDAGELGADGIARRGQRLAAGDELRVTGAESGRQRRGLLGEVRIGGAQARQRIRGQLFGKRAFDHVVDTGPGHLLGLDPERGHVCPAAGQFVVDPQDVAVVDELPADADELVLGLVVLHRPFGGRDLLAQFGQTRGERIGRPPRRVRLDLGQMVDEGIGDQTRQPGGFLRVFRRHRDVEDEALGIARDPGRLAQILHRLQEALVGRGGGGAGEAEAFQRRQQGFALAVELGIRRQVGALDDLGHHVVGIDDRDLALDQGERRLRRQAVRRDLVLHHLDVAGIGEDLRIGGVFLRHRQREGDAEQQPEDGRQDDQPPRRPDRLEDMHRVDQRAVGFLHLRS